MDIISLINKMFSFESVFAKFLPMRFLVCLNGNFFTLSMNTAIMLECGQKQAVRAPA